MFTRRVKNKTDPLSRIARGRASARGGSGDRRPHSPPRPPKLTPARTLARRREESKRNDVCKAVLTFGHRMRGST
jgi:hypothetical protein